MEYFKARPLIAVTLLVTLVMASPCFSRGRLHLHVRKMGSEVYEVDYKGPETHTYTPPPNRDRPRLHHQDNMAHHRPNFNKPKHKIGKKMHGW